MAYAVSAAFRNGLLNGAKQDLKLYFPGSSTTLCAKDGYILSSGATFDEYFNTSYDLTLGETPSASFSVSIINKNGTLDGFDFGECEVSIGVWTGSAYEYCPMGVYYLKRQKKTISDIITITDAMDKMGLFDVDAHDFLVSVTYPTTLNAICSALISYVGATESVQTFTDVTISTDPFAVSCTCRELLGWIAAKRHTIARFNRVGEVEFVWLGSSVAETVPETRVEVNAEVADYKTTKITQSVIKTLGNIAYVTGATNDNVYYTLGNPLYNSADTDLYDFVRAFPLYYPVFSANVVRADPSVDLGDIVELSIYQPRTGAIETYPVPLMHRTLTWASESIATYSANGNEVRETPDLGQYYLAISTSISGSAVGSATAKQQYYLSTSSSSTTGGSWQDTVPTWSSGKYVWTRVATTTTTISGTPSTSYSTGVYDKNLTDALSTAASAESTASSAQTTANGAVASASVKTQYYLSTSSSSATGGSWSDTIPTWASGKYIWTRVATTTTNGSGTSSTSYAPSSSGAYDKNLTNALSTAATASSTASAAQTTAAVALERGVEYIIGTQAASTNAWTGVTTDSAIYAGKTIAYYLPYAGTSSAATLNLTLSGGGTTGAKNVRINNTNVTTNYPAGTIIRLTYDGTYWKSDNYDSNNYDRTMYNSNILAVSAITAAHLIVGTSAGYKHLAASVAFDLSYPILYAGSAIAANANGTNNYTMMSGVNFSTTGTIQSGASKKVLYLKGTVSGTTFTAAASNWLTTVVPTAASTDFYIPLGVMSSSTSGSFLSSSQLWAYVNGFFQQVQAITKDASLQEQTIYISKASGTSSVSATTTWITNTTGNQNVWTLKRPVYSTSYPVLFVAVQRKTVGGTITCTTPVKDDTTTVIDGGHIITGSIDASKITVTDLSALNATIAEWTINQAYIGKSAAFDFSNVSITEAAYIRQYLLGQTTLANAIAHGADIDGDGDVTLLDLALVRNLLLGFIPTTGTAKVSMRSDNPFSALAVDVGGVTLFEAGIHGCFAPNIYASRIAGIEQNSANSFPGPLAIDGSTVSIKGDDWGSVPKIANATNSIYSLTGSKKLCIQFVTKTVSMKVDQAWGTWYESNAQVDFGNWPTAFSARPYVAYKIFNSDTASASQVMGQGTKAPTTTQVGSAYIYRPTANANNTTYTGMAIGIGYIA